MPISSAASSAAVPIRTIRCCSARSGARASSYDPCISANSGCGRLASTGTISDRNVSSVHRERRRRTRARRVSNAERASPARDERACAGARPRGREHAILRQERDVRTCRALQAPRERVVDGLRRAAGIRSRPGANTGTATSWNSVPSSSADAPPRLPPSRSPRAAATALRSPSAGAVCSDEPRAACRARR